MVEHFKNELKNYKYYQETLRELKNSLSLVWYELTGVKGIQYDKQKASFSKDIAIERKHELLSKVDKLTVEINRVEMQLYHIKNVLAFIKSNNPEIEKAMIKIYAEGSTFRKEAKEYATSYVTLYKKVNEEIDRAIQELIKK